MQPFKSLLWPTINHHRSILWKNNTLQIRSPTTEDVGEYMCVVQTGIHRVTVFATLSLACTIEQRKTIPLVSNKKQNNVLGHTKGTFKVCKISHVRK